jgi:CHAT domain
MGLLLEALDADGPLRWRWWLTDEETGNPLADHAVNIDPESRDLAIFRDLDSYIYSYAAPDRRVDDGARFVQQAGEWAGRELLGEAVGEAILAEAPVTVRVTVPDALAQVLLWPLELAHADGKPLAAQGDVTLVYDIAPAAPVAQTLARRKSEVTGALRMLAVFSQPTATSVLALRRERYALTRLIRTIAARERALIQLMVVQYGVTRQRLAKIVDSGDGWDMLHLSGHGTGGVFTLETRDGTPDHVSTSDLAALLRPARHRLKLAIVSACESAADTTAQTLRLLGLTDQAEALEAAEEDRGTQGAPAGQATMSDGQVTAPEGVPGAEGGQRPATSVRDAAPSGSVVPPARHRSAHVVGLAQTLVRELDCAVVGMRYPVADEFAIAFADVFYEHLLSRCQPADVAVARAVAGAARSAPSAAIPAASIATPAVFGARAAGLKLPVPHGSPVIDPAGQRMAYFPGEPPRFVGRAAAMARASAALAPGSGRTAVLLHGMAGAGKTACALELAYRHAGSFAAAAWWQAPTREEEWPTALADLANRLDIQLADSGFTIAGHIGTVTALENFLPRLRSAMANSGVLLVLDNLETLLTPGGAWRDDRMAKLITALTDHDGESRVILTSRVPPANLTSEPLAARAVTLPVNALSLDESVALARELPNLRALLHDDASPVRTDQPARAERLRAAEADRDRVRRVLRVVQGHPKLMELADAAAVNRDRLDAQLAAAEHAVTAEGSLAGRSLDAFFRDGTSTLHPAQFLDTLTAWTVTALDVLSPAARLMAEFVACLEDNDRVSDVIEATWAGLCWRLGRLVYEPGPGSVLGESPASAPPAPDAAGGVPSPELLPVSELLSAPDAPGMVSAPGPLLATLTAAALIEAESLPSPGGGGGADAVEQPGEEAGASSEDRPVAGGGPGPVAYRLHPGVAAAITAQAGPGVREAVDAWLAAFWDAVSEQARERAGGEDSGRVVRAGLAAAPYLLRRGDWDTAGFLLDHAVVRDRSPGTVQAVLPSLRRIAAATGKPEDASALGRVLAGVDAGEAERRLRGAVDAAAGSGGFQIASAAAGELVTLLMAAGRLGEALAVAGDTAEFTGRAGLGPWTRLGDQARRLQVLRRMGEHARVLAETETLRAAMAGLPARRGASEAVNPWNVRETILNVGRASALATEDWKRCLDLNAEIAASVRQRGAGVHEVTRTRCNDAGPLIELGRLGEAGRLLAECQRVFEDHADPPRLAMVLGTRASLEAVLGRRQEAADLGRAALRLSYARPEPRDIAASHHNLALYLGWLGGDRAEQRAHRLAAALICQMSGMAHDLARTLRALAAELRGDDPAAGLPATVAQVVADVERTEGVRLGALLAALQPDPQAVEDALAEILRTAAELPPQDSEPDIATYLQRWEPVIAAIATICQTGQAPPAELAEFLDEQAKQPDWAALAAVLRRILAGERDEVALLTGLDPVDTAIARETLRRLEQPA